jgi:hypothetical protein
VSLRDLPLLVDHVRDAFRIFVIRCFGSTVGETDLPIRVAQERKGKVELAGEGVVLFRSVEADTEDLGILREILLVEVPEPGTFPRSTRCVGLRIKPEHDLLPAQTAERDTVAVVVEYVEVGSLLTWLEHE